MQTISWEEEWLHGKYQLEIIQLLVALHKINGVSNLTVDYARRQAIVFICFMFDERSQTSRYYHEYIDINRYR